MVRKAVIPAAGYGTRFLPATKSQPKEMLPVVDTPTIQYVVQEAIDAGLTDILMIIGRGKRSIEEHFGRNAELEDELARVTQGNPFFLGEIIRKLVRDQKVALVGQQWALKPLEYGYLPDSLQEIVVEMIPRAD